MIKFELLLRIRLIHVVFQQFDSHMPVEQKDVDEVVFRRFQGEGVEFF